MPKFRKKPVEIEAIRFTRTNWKDVLSFTDYKAHIFVEDDIYSLFIWSDNPKNVKNAIEGDWVIKGAKGKFRTCKPNIFQKTYELIKSKK